MNDVVPVALQRLREADIVGLAGLANASLGQAYARRGYVSTTRRREARLSGVVSLPERSPEPGVARVEQPEDAATGLGAERHFEVEVEVAHRDSCQAVCTCGNASALLCVHAAALLYHWVNRPHAFVTLPARVDEDASPMPGPASLTAPKAARTFSDDPPPEVPSVSRYAPLPVRKLSVNSVGETVGQLGLSELRSLAREYDIAPPGLAKQQLIETLIETLSQPEAVRRVVAALEKPQRQLLAAFALAGGVMSDEELRGLFERFSLANAGTLQNMLIALQAKLLIVRTSFQHSLQPRTHLAVSPLDLSWYIPQEVREALHVTLPTTPFDPTVPYGKGAGSTLPTLCLAEPYRLLEDMLLSARVLDGLPADLLEKRPQRVGSFPATRLAADGSLALPAPEDQPSVALVETVQAEVSRSPALLRFAIRLLHLSDLLYKEESWQATLHVLPDAGRLLLGSARNDVLHELFTRWLKQNSYAELFELSEHGVRIRCRATPLNQPALRRGELEQENNEARQELLSLLAQVPGGQWINFAAFARFVYRLHPTFLQRRQRLFPSPHWWVEQQEGRLLHPTQLTDWLRVEGRYLAYLIQGPLHWWGACDLALAANGQLLAFRLAPLASLFFQGIPPAALEHTRAASPSVSPALTVSEAGNLLIPCQAANWPLIACVEDFAESNGVQYGQLSYRLTPRSLGEAMSRGRVPRELLTLLARSCAEDEQGALYQLLNGLERRIAHYGRVRIYTDVSLLQTSDASVMQQLHALTSLEEQTLRALHPNLLLLKARGMEQLMEELKRRGQIPLLHEGS